MTNKDKENRVYFEKLSEQYVEDIIEKTANTSTPDKEIGNKILSENKLKEYVFSIIQTYGALYFLQNRLADLMYQKNNNEKLLKSDKAELKVKVEADYKKLIEQQKKNRKLLDSYLCGEIELSEDEILEAGITVPKMPQKPSMNHLAVKCPKKPTVPNYKVPGFFNKRAIQQENEVLRQKYENDMAVFDKKMDSYKKYLEHKESFDLAMQEYQRMKMQYDSDKAEADQLINNLKKKRAALLATTKKKEIKKLELSVQNSKKKSEEDLKQLIDRYSSYAIDKMLSKQITETKKRIREIVKRLEILYSYDVVYPKYRDYVSLCSFYEYLDSGRCDSLEGPFGAYNLYETDIKANLVLEKLSLIAEKLEDIKKNQNTIYTAMKEIKSELVTISNKLQNAVNELNAIGMEANLSRITMEDIRSLSAINVLEMNTIAQNTAISAYYSAENAYWARKNAEISNSLGFLIALK